MRGVFLGGIELKASWWLIPLVGIACWLGHGVVVVALMVSLIVHEAAHVVVARLCGFVVESLEVMPFGCVARMVTMSEGSMQEALIALAGPVMSVLLAMLAVFLNQYIGGAEDLLRQCAHVNLTLAGFNMLPALPLDGGRVLRSLLSRRLGVVRATHVVAWTGRALGTALVALGAWGITQGAINLTFIAAGIMMFVGASREASLAATVMTRDLSLKRHTLHARGALPVRHLVAMRDESLSRLARRMLPRHYHVITLLDSHMHECGRVDEGEIAREILHGRGARSVGELCDNSKRRQTP